MFFNLRGLFSCHDGIPQYVTPTFARERASDGLKEPPSTQRAQREEGERKTSKHHSFQAFFDCSRVEVDQEPHTMVR
jgi:hypothetical protein